ncbi:hypothetical protein F5Y10DRAFT_261492 [Nemania abortiva]|nr:hypothetical protein F5Y10DRAFT_261492 [Nemania abortiva]
MLASKSTQAWSLKRLISCLLVTILMFCIHFSHAYILPGSITKLESRKNKSTIGSTPRQPGNFPRDFATAVGVAVAAVMIGTTAICVFAHCWRQILDWGRGDDRGVGVIRKRVRKDEEAWFCGADRGLPMPQFDILPESEPLAQSVPTPQPDIYTGPGHHYSHDKAAAPTVHARNIVPGSRTRPKEQWNNSGASLPSWLDSGEIERPASVVYLLDRP